MRDHSSIVQEMDRQGRYLHSILKTDKLNKLAWLEFRHYREGDGPVDG